MRNVLSDRIVAKVPVFATLVVVGLTGLGCSSPERTITPAEDKMYRNPPKTPPPGYKGADMGKPPTPPTGAGASATGG